MFGMLLGYFKGCQFEEVVVHVLFLFFCCYEWGVGSKGLI